MKLLMLAGLALTLSAPVAATNIFTAHDREPVSRACPHPDDVGRPDGDHDCDDGVGVPVDNGWAPTLLLAIGATGVLWLSRRRHD